MSENNQPKLDHIPDSPRTTLGVRELDHIPDLPRATPNPRNYSRFIRVVIWVLVLFLIIFSSIKIYSAPPNWLRDNDFIGLIILNLPSIILMAIYLHGRRVFSWRVLCKILLHAVVISGVFMVTNLNNFVIPLLLIPLLHFLLSFFVWNLRGLSLISFIVFLSVFGNVALFTIFGLIAGFISLLP